MSLLSKGSSLHLLLIIIISLTLSSPTKNLLDASDTIVQGQFLSGNQTIVSKDGTFELGFFAPGNSGNYYIGTWYRKLPNQTIIWVANREAPVSDPSTSKLTVSGTGNLVLFNSSNTRIWSSTNPATKASTAAVLLNTGNLVLISAADSESYLWESFDHPTDTFMPGSRLGLNKITGEYQKLTSWKNINDPAPGLFSDSLDPNGSDQYVLMWNESQVYWSTGLWNGQYFNGTPVANINSAINLSFIDNEQRKYAIYTILDDSLITRAVLSTSGQLQQFFWESSSQQWQSVFTEPLRLGDVYSLCGPFGVYDERSETVCRCPDGFEPSNSHDWSSGCSRRSRLQCGDKDGFLEMPDIRLKQNPEKIVVVGSSKECEVVCSRDCSCSAYAYFDTRCSVLKGDVRNLEQLYDHDRGDNTTFFLRVLASDIPSSGTLHNKKVLRVILISVVFGATAIICIVLGLVRAYHIRRRTEPFEQAEGPLIQFSYRRLQQMTDNFSEELGHGGFGTVFKGKMTDSATIAVKKLQGLRQGEKQFRTEVRTLGVIQHVNLVRLHGFCSQGSNRLLVYEYMSRGSLASQLFQDGPPILDWRTRYQIILGAAKGLAYLHEECRERIIHCDIKPDNILIDEGFVPKVSDFGMAKLVGRDFSRVLTTIRGTIGYLAPEWISGQPITPKADVYSFGMMMFELVSGRRNTQHLGDGSSICFYPSLAAVKVLSDDAMTVLDERLEGVADAREVSKVCKVAIWCVQDVEDDRPSMVQVVQILEGAFDVTMPPVPALLQINEEDHEPVYCLKNHDSV